MLQRRMPGRLMGSLPLFGGGQTYLQKVIGAQLDDLIQYHPMPELAGVVAIDYSPEGNDGAYTGVTLGQPGIGDGLTCPYFDGINDYNNVYSAGLAADWDGAEYTVAIWAVPDDWTTNNLRMLILRADANNLVQFYQGATDGQARLDIVSGGVGKNFAIPTGSPTTFSHFAITNSESADEAKAYFNGIQNGATQAGLGAWVGALNVSRCIVGASTLVPGLPYAGYLAHYAVWKSALSAEKILSIGTL